MQEKRLNTKDLKEKAEDLRASERILLSGTVYTARDSAHKRIKEFTDKGKRLPFEINGSVIYYCGPTPAFEGLTIGSCGPTTSNRMDPFTPDLLDMGLCAMIGKGDRGREVYRAIVRNKAVYLCAIGGAGALAAKCIVGCEVIAFDDLGCESIKKLEFKDFPLFVAIDSKGNSLFNT
ncbi:MAG: FumA C-terminus/TtdB family hydratase beta subunit [Oscillospiraceae bacterium]|jgi:fumarate hydratase subunit beta|nr:FumA C-terminus/TtdB family hydratase beta subunit [Oscillospiraceae bacterium]